MSTLKIALVTGGSRGIGKDTALSLAKQGHHVLLTYQSKEADAQAVVADIEGLGQKAAALQLDVSNVASFDDFFARVKSQLASTFGAERFDFLINYVSPSTAGYPRPGYALHGGSKVAPQYLVQVLAQEVGKRGVTVNSILPTVTQGPASTSRGLVRPASTSLSRTLCPWAGSARRRTWPTWPSSSPASCRLLSAASSSC